MDIDYHNYMSYILGELFLVDDILLPYNQKVNKYDFLIEVSQIFLIYKSEYCKFPNNFINDILKKLISNYTCDNDIKKLCDIINSRVTEQEKKYTYDKVTDILIRTAIVIENLYLCRSEQLITYKTSSFDINHVLWFIERQLNLNGIRNSGYDKAKKTYDFYNAIETIQTNFHEHIKEWHVAFIRSMKDAKGNDLDNEFNYIYLEVLLLIANTYIEEVCYNE